MTDNDLSTDSVSLQVGSAVAGGALGAILSGPIGLILGAAASPLLQYSVEWLRSDLAARREANVATVIALASHFTGVQPEVLLRRVLSIDDKREIFVSTLKTAQDASKQSKLVSLARSLSTTYVTDDQVLLHSESAFVRALDQLDSLHVQMLKAFTATSNENNLGDGTAEFDQPVTQLNILQLQLALPTYGKQIPALLAGLQAQGLISLMNPGAGVATYDGAVVNMSGWEITEIGRDFLERLLLVDELLDVAPDS